jgi:hypothetical protein
MALEPMVAFAPISGSVATALHHRNSELLESKDTHRPRVLQQSYTQERRTTLGAVRVLDFE